MPPAETRRSPLRNDCPTNDRDGDGDGGEIHFGRKSKMSLAYFLTFALRGVKNRRAATAKKKKRKRGHLTLPMRLCLFFPVGRQGERYFFLHAGFAASVSADSFVLRTRYPRPREELILQKIFLHCLDRGRP